MRVPKIVTLLSDFGLQDPYAGVMKGVIFRHCPDCQVVDLTHLIPPQDIRLGAIQLERAVPHFPVGTVHLAVVDPGVGSHREPVVIVGQKATYVGPNNGLFSLALRHDHIHNVYVIQPGRQTHHQPSTTFHGRDLFAPVAAKLAGGLNPQEVGPALAEPLVQLDLDDLQQRVLCVDRFGNVQLGIHRERWQGGMGKVRLGQQTIPFHLTYSQVAPGDLLCLWNSDGYLELALNGGNAADMLGLRAGQVVDYEVVA
ncbi:SAM-dependent chlorinase/fluorinase [bacterium]|nr:SAM-dependent chlorinase/fluorinase [bacterium]